MNRSDAPARTLVFSSARVPAVSVYPDSDKVGVYPRDSADAVIFRRGTAVPWGDREDGWNRADYADADPSRDRAASSAIRS